MPPRPLPFAAEGRRPDGADSGSRKGEDPAGCPPPCPKQKRRAAVLLYTARLFCFSLDSTRGMRRLLLVLFRQIFFRLAILFQGFSILTGQMPDLVGKGRGFMTEM